MPHSRSSNPKVVLLGTSRFHFFDLARQLDKHGMLEAFFTGYPLWKIRNEGIPLSRLKPFPWMQFLYMVQGRLQSKRNKPLSAGQSQLDAHLEWMANRAIDAYAAAKLPNCDILIAASNTGLRTGETLQKRGGIYICDRPCSHIRYQNDLLKEEFSRYGIRFSGIDPRTISRSEQEYKVADCIVVPSTFAQRSFSLMGVSAHKVYRVGLGVDLSRYSPVAKPDPDTFEVLFVGSVTLRKGIPYLLQAFEKVRHPRKKLVIAGVPAPEVVGMIQKYAQHLPIDWLGHVPHEKVKELMSRSHVFVLPTIEDGFGLVMAEAMACGCPVISTTNSGAPDLYENGKAGFILPIRDVTALTESLEAIANDRTLRAQMSDAALKNVSELGGWNTYGSNMVALLKQVATK